MANESAGSAMSASFWRQAGGQAWADLQALMDRLNQPIGEAVAAQAGLGFGGRALDVGCGAGDTTLDMARRLAPGGRCVGVDVSEPLLEIGRRRAQAEGVANAEFVLGDAQDYAFEAEAFDAVISRFGVMFFEAPDLAFANLRRALRPDGRLAFACWRSPAENPLSQIPLEAAAPFLSKVPQAEPDGPGRFAFADPARVQAILDRSGWREVEIAPLNTPTPLTFDELMRLSLDLGALGPLLRDESEAVRARVHDAVAARLRPFVEDGMVSMTAACWLVTARR